MIRIGQGYDVHKLAYDRELIVGGIKIPYEKGLLGHSDADVLLHAITDAIIGAIALVILVIFFRTQIWLLKMRIQLSYLRKFGRR